MNDRGDGSQAGVQKITVLEWSLPPDRDVVPSIPEETAEETIEESPQKGFQDPFERPKDKTLRKISSQRPSSSMRSLSLLHNSISESNDSLNFGRPKSTPGQSSRWSLTRGQNPVSQDSSSSKNIDQTNEQTSRGLDDTAKAGAMLKENPTGLKTRTRHRLGLVLLSLFGWLAVVNALTYLIIEFGILERSSPDWNTEKKFNDMESRVEIYKRIVKETVPFVQEWYRISHKASAPLSSLELSSPKTEDACLEPFFTLLDEVAEFTSPDDIEGVLKSMGLSDLPVIRSFLKEYLESPQPIAAMYSRSLSCLQDSKHISRMACTVKDKISLDGFASDQATARFIRDHIHRAVVLEVLTPALLDDVAALFQVQEVMRFQQYFTYKDFLSRKFRNDKNRLEFSLAKYEGMMSGLEVLGDMIASNDAPPGLHKSLQINILEAVKLDALNGFESNALLGLSVAATAKFDPVVKDQKLSWALGQDWVDSYISWNLAFVLGNLSVHVVPKLLIPSVSCTIGSEHGKDFMAPRIVSLALALMQSNAKPLLPSSANNETSFPNTESYYALYDTPPRLSQTGLGASLVNQLGEEVARHAVLQRPSTDAVERMLYDLCGENCHEGSWKVMDTIPNSNLDHKQFKVYLGFILWITCLLAGIGSELLVYILYLVKQDGWTEGYDRMWIMAQLFFPLLAATTLGLAVFQNYMALPFLISGLWKFGFPETLLYQHSALFGSGGGDGDSVGRICDFLNGSGLVAHHGAASMLICMILAGAIVADDHVVSCILLLLMQHWFVLVSHVSPTVYIILELTLELWFEWTIISEFQHLASNHWTASCKFPFELFVTSHLSHISLPSIFFFTQWPLELCFLHTGSTYWLPGLIFFSNQMRQWMMTTH